MIAVARTQVARRGVRPHLGLEAPRVITIGIDPHKSSHTAVALDETGALLGELRVPADSSTRARLGTWAASWPQRVWAIERASGLGRLLAQQLVASGETVVDVPSALAARTRVLQRGHGRKSDGIDERSVAVVAQHRDDLSRVAPDDHCAVLRLLSDRRDELTSERRRVVNRLHRLLRDLRPGGAPRQLSADRASRLLATIRPAGAVDIERKAMARQLIADVARIDRALIDNRRRCAEAVAASGSSLTEIFGISEVLAAKILGHTGDITRFANADRYASYAGTAPIEVSSGDQRRHRLSRAGNRSLNHALHLAARVQTMHPGPGRTHYARKQAEQKTPAEALRSLKRQLAKVVYRHLRDDHAHQASPSPRLTNGPREVTRHQLTTLSMHGRLKIGAEHARRDDGRAHRAGFGSGRHASPADPPGRCTWRVAKGRATWRPSASCRSGPPAAARLPG